ncbi:hypothetical protein COCC4DRAFT_62827 [Bipolaris maydis ATCC 48331]|uniref:DUF7924 domain-containing protein n=2 Tax=Cochliobolus heterostrophus TaxID=5016 RepID=M2UFA0_COCH5|nr:uncharacterized protein COCC4DRAFT_62827 [Bipolaris maydis ATCC 48331]EMD86587.1 hypothetical protein COCHEDRAFT_1115461 [Bipolaris maydis C5]ENI03000.1 hypothetical protein COCC4DRAFT_62827 [Bipolaris maydis ATCC 48331]KAJ6267487.1 hypothetical protein PSV08DRAFT_186454 [Bipolaris maydis]KAJ6267566.1 hypothetical protein PSV08DRAFT_187195 [Bipolaris maydis]
MAPTPRSTTSSTHHSSKHQRRTPYTKATKATKTVAPQAYRQQNMQSACIYVDQAVELPPQVDEYVRHVLGTTSWEDRVPIPDQLGSQRRFLDLAETFWSQSRNSASKCALEGDWQCNLYQLVSTMAELSGGVLETNVSEKLWNPQLIGRLSSLDKSRNEAKEPTHTDSPGIDASVVMVTDLDPSESMSLCSHSNSVMSTARTNVKSSSDILTPKPDITMGLTHKAFTREHQRLLIDYQDRELILSDPHAAVMGMRFPFMIAELKSIAPLSKAQNQAAVGGACMLTILEDLAYQAARGTNLQAPPLTTAADLPLVPVLCFSVVTEGPVHELWVHFRREDGFHMVNLKIWRTTIRGHAEELVNCLGRITEWGKGHFKDRVLEMLGRVRNL